MPESMEKFGFGQITDADRLTYLHLGKSDQEWLKTIGRKIQSRLPEIVDRFYEYLGQFPPTQELVSTPDLMRRLKATQLEYFQTLFEAQFNNNYFFQRKLIGKTHRRIGLDPNWYIGGYSLFCEIFFPILHEQFQDNRAGLLAAQTALMKAFFLDLQLAVETYIESYARQLIEAQQALEHKLWIEDRILYSIMKKAGDAIIGLDEHDRIVTWSQSAQRIFGYKTIEIIDKKPTDLIQNPTQFALLKTNAQEQGTHTLQATTWRAKNGSLITTDTTLTYLRDQSGAHVGTTLIIQDMTEVHRLASEVKNMEKLSAMTKITAGVAHEIRNPLGVLTLTTDLIQERMAQATKKGEISSLLFEEINDQVTVMQSEVTRLNEIVNHYLVLSRIKSPSKAPVHLQSYLEQLMPDLMTHLAGKEIQIQLDQVDPRVEVLIDPDHFRHVFQNLFENAVHAIPQAGKIHIQAKQIDRHVQIAFRDSGVGISQDRIHMLFSPFVTNKPGGTGLGLYLVKEIVDAHHGRVSIKSEESCGTTVYIELPLAADELNHGRYA